MEKLKSELEGILDVWELESYLQEYDKQGILDEVVDFILKDEVFAKIYEMSKHRYFGNAAKTIVTTGIIAYTVGTKGVITNGFEVRKVFEKYVENDCADDPFAYKFYKTYKE